MIVEKITAKTTAEVLARIDELNGDTEIVRFSIRPTALMVRKLVENLPDIKEITYSDSLDFQISKRTREMAKEENVRLVPSGIHVGRPGKYGVDIIKKVKRDRADKMPVKDICEIYGIPTRTVYYLTR